MTTARFTFGLAVVAVLIMLGPVNAMCRTRKLLTGELPAVPVAADACVLSNLPEDTVTFNNPQIQITKGSDIFMGSVDSCASWQVEGNTQGEYRTWMLCGGGKPAADQFCRSNDFTKAGLFQISTAYLDFTYSISDYKICYRDSCLGFDSIQCQTCQSDMAEQGSESEISAASVETSTQTFAGAPAPGPAASYASLGVASLYSINSSAFCYNNGYGNVGCYNVGNNNIGDNNFGDYNMGSYNNGSFNNGTGNLGNFNLGLNNSGDYNRGVYNSGVGNNGTYNLGVNNTGNFNHGVGNAGDNNLGTYNAGQVNAGNGNNGIGNSGNNNSGTWNAGNLNLGNNNGGNSNEGDNNRGDGLMG